VTGRTASCIATAEVSTTTVGGLADCPKAVVLARLEESKADHRVDASRALCMYQ